MSLSPLCRSPASWEKYVVGSTPKGSFVFNKHLKGTIPYEGVIHFSRYHFRTLVDQYFIQA